MDTNNANDIPVAAEYRNRAVSPRDIERFHLNCGQAVSSGKGGAR